MQTTRRITLKTAGSVAVLAALGLLHPAALAQTAQNKSTRSPAFTARKLADALAQLRGNGSIANADDGKIDLQAPEIAENGAQVTLSVYSRIPDTAQIMLLIEKNPFPLAASFNFPEGTEPFFQTRVKMAESSRVLALVRTNQGKLYMTAKETRVTLGGCGV